MKKWSILMGIFFLFCFCLYPFWHDTGESGDVLAMERGGIGGEIESKATTTSSTTKTTIWSPPTTLPADINVEGGWTDMPSITLGGDLFFVFWNGDPFEYIDYTGEAAVLQCVETYEGGHPGNHDEEEGFANFDIYFADMSQSKDIDVDAVFHSPNEQISTTPDSNYLDYVWDSSGCVQAYDLETECPYPSLCLALYLAQFHEVYDCEWLSGELELELEEEFDTCSFGLEIAAAASFDGNSVYFARVVYDYDTGTGCLRDSANLFVTHKTKRGWSDAKRLPATINKNGYRLDMPTISPDNKRLCFSRSSISRTGRGFYDVDPETLDHYGVRAYQIYCSDRPDEEKDKDWDEDWEEARLMPFLEEGNEPLSCLDWQSMFTPDGNLLISSNRIWCLDDPRDDDYQQTIHFAKHEQEATCQDTDPFHTGDCYVVSDEKYPPMEHYDSEDYHLEGAGSLQTDFPEGGSTLYFLRATKDPPNAEDMCDMGLRIHKSECDECIAEDGTK